MPRQGMPRHKSPEKGRLQEVDFGLRDWFKFGQDAPVQLRKGRLKALKKNAPLGALSKQRHRKAAAQPAALPVRPLGVPRLSGGLSSFFSAVIHLPPVAGLLGQARGRCVPVRRVPLALTAVGLRT